MKTSLALSTLVLASGLLGLSASASAGTLSVNAALTDNPDGHDDWTDNDDGSSSLVASAVAVGSTFYDHCQRAGSVIVLISHTADSLSDTPLPRSAITYTAGLVGRWQYSLLGRSAPQGSASGSYEGGVVKASGPPDDIGDQFGPIYQGTTYQGVGSQPTEKDVSNQTLPIPSGGWGTPTHNPDGTYTYTYTKQILSASGQADALCDVNWKGSNAQTDWFFDIDLTTLSAIG